MELDELAARLERFARAKLDDPGATIQNVKPGPGHAGFSYFFDVISHGLVTSYFLRLPPPGVKHEGTGDVMRQVAAVRALKDTNVPHAPILWASAEEDWFGDPYFIQPRLEGDTLKDDWPLQFSNDQLRAMAKDAMTALAGIHKVDPARRPTSVTTGDTSSTSSAGNASTSAPPNPSSWPSSPESNNSSWKISRTTPASASSTATSSGRTSSTPPARNCSPSSTGNSVASAPR